MNRQVLDTTSGLATFPEHSLPSSNPTFVSVTDNGGRTGVR